MEANESTLELASRHLRAVSLGLGRFAAVAHHPATACFHVSNMHRKRED